MQTGQRDRFGQQVHRTGLHGIDCQCHARVARHHHNTWRIVLLAQGTYHLQAIHSRQLKVDNHHIGLNALCDLHTQRTVVGDLYRMPLFFEIAGDVFRQHQFVFDHQ